MVRFSSAPMKRKRISDVCNEGGRPVRSVHFCAGTSSGVMIGVWFRPASIGYNLAGRVGSLYESFTLPGIFTANAVFMLAFVAVMMLLIVPSRNCWRDGALRKALSSLCWRQSSRFGQACSPPSDHCRLTASRRTRPVAAAWHGFSRKPMLPWIGTTVFLSFRSQCGTASSGYSAVIPRCIS